MARALRWRHGRPGRRSGDEAALALLELPTCRAPSMVSGIPARFATGGRTGGQRGGEASTGHIRAVARTLEPTLSPCLPEEPEGSEDSERDVPQNRVRELVRTARAIAARWSAGIPGRSGHSLAVLSADDHMAFRARSRACTQAPFGEQSRPAVLTTPPGPSDSEKTAPAGQPGPVARPSPHGAGVSPLSAPADGSRQPESAFFPDLPRADYGPAPSRRKRVRRDGSSQTAVERVHGACRP
jgi:hypothetical protein